MNSRFRAIAFNGLNTDSLGNYLAGLGLISAVAQKWSNMRSCWTNRRLTLLVNDPSVDENAIKAFLLSGWQRTSYDRWWSLIQKSDTKGKTSAGIWRERSQRSMADVRVLDAHIVGAGRNRFNPVLGTGGNVGKRDLAKACKDAIKLLEKPERTSWLDATLMGQTDVALPDLNNGGTWFVFANKTFNSGQDWFREGQLSPWSVLLATEGAFQLVGGVNRRLGSRARPYAVFPFVSEPAQPESDGEIGMSRAEFWAPLWTFPATLCEIRALFQRGLAKLGGRPASAPHEFAVAALAAGVDSGITEFARFEFRQTTSSQVYEAIPRDQIPVSSNSSPPHQKAAATKASHLLVQLIESGWLDRLPFEPRDAKQKGKFVGLRGQIESAIVRVGERPEDCERWQELLLRMSVVQLKMDRNKELRKRCTPIPLLSSEWVELAWPEPIPEIEIASSIASLGWFCNAASSPFASNVFGVKISSRQNVWRASFSESRTAQVVWDASQAKQSFLNVAQRRLIDAAGDSLNAPFAGTSPCAYSLIQQFITADETIGTDAIAKWIPALSLINWSNGKRSSSGSSDNQSSTVRFASDGASMLHALVRPLFHCDKNRNVQLDEGKPLFCVDQLPKANLQRRLFNLLRFGQLDELLQVVRDRYLAIGRSIVMPPKGLIADCEQVATALLIPMTDRDVAWGLKRWIQPTRIP
jgi:CRISPR-associated protein Csx17